MKKLSLITLFSVGVIALFVLFNTTPLHGGGRSLDAPRSYKVTVTNITRGQPLSPVLLATHSSALDPIFEVGEPASAELYPLAEDAMLTPLTNKLQNDGNVWEVKTIFGSGGPILPGESASVIIDSDIGFNEISMASMLVVTNDAFVGLSGAKLPMTERIVMYYAPAYDAGSETNNESGRFIPGPPFGQGGSRDTSMAEGFVHVHSGVFGKANLIPEMHDWKNPVARIVIEVM